MKNYVQGNTFIQASRPLSRNAIINHLFHLRTSGDYPPVELKKLDHVIAAYLLEEHDNSFQEALFLIGSIKPTDVLQIDVSCFVIASYQEGKTDKDYLEGADTGPLIYDEHGELNGRQ